MWAMEQWGKWAHLSSAGMDVRQVSHHSACQASTATPASGCSVSSRACTCAPPRCTLSSDPVCQPDSDALPPSWPGFQLNACEQIPSWSSGCNDADKEQKGVNSVPIEAFKDVAHGLA